MSEFDLHQRTEQATPRRIQEARKKGQVLRVRDLSNTIFLTLVSGLLLIVENYIFRYTNFMATFFYEGINSAEHGFNIHKIISTCLAFLSLHLLPFLIIILLVGIVSSIIPGGFVFSLENIKFNMNKLSLIQGLKRMFALKTFMELLKSISKLLVISIVLIYVFKQYFTYDAFTHDGFSKNIIFESLHLLYYYTFIFSLSLFVVAFIDWPIQYWDFYKKLRMSKQEIKEELKETEGRPEVKSKIKKVQRQIANHRMISDVKKANVIIINPQHFSVALRYQEGKDSAPLVLAKGVELVALQIRKVAKHHKIPLVSAPKLTRAIYYSTKIGQQVPTGLYVAVAQVLAYVYQLQRYYKGEREKPILNKDLPIPDHYKT